MGEQDVSGTKRVISSQPHLGSLFKSQNNRTWDAIQSQDKKFTLYIQYLQLVVQLFHLQNNIIGERNTNEEGSTTSVYGQKLLANPITISNGVTKVKVQHRDHGMYSTSNNVVLLVYHLVFQQQLQRLL